MTREMISPEESLSRFDPALRDLASRSMGCLMSTTDGGMVRSHGSCTLVELDGRRFVLTAKHVADGLGRAANLLVVPDGSARAAPMPPIEYSVPLHDPVCSNDAMDVAVVRPPEVVLADQRLAWLSLDAASRSITWLRENWRSFDTADGFLPMFVHGFPRLLHERRMALKTETLGAISWQAAVSALEAEPSGPLMEPAQQLALRVPVEPVDPPPTNGRAAELFRLFFPDGKNADGALFGGYSGGPVLLGANGTVLLVGSIKEGGTPWNHAVWFATPIDETIALLRKQLA